MTQKKLERNSRYKDLDLDGDGIVSDTELAAIEAIETAEKIKKKLIREAVKTYLRSDPRKLGGRTMFHNSIKEIKKSKS